MFDTQPTRKNPIGIAARIDRMVEAVGPANQAFLAQCVAQRRNQPQKENSIYAWVHPVCRFDAFVQGAPFIEAATGPTLTAFLTSLRQEVGPRTLLQASAHLKVLWKDLHDTDALPRSVRKALKVNIPRDAPSGELVREQDFLLLLEETSSLDGTSDGVPTALVFTALLWVLYEAGLRAEEALHLLVRDVELTGPDTARLHLRADGRPLKTGPRVVPVQGAGVQNLRALLSMHPHRKGPNSPLFPAERRRETSQPCQAGCWCGGSGRLRYEAMRRTLEWLAQESGVNDNRPWTANVTAHDFRHTCATNKARLGWNEEMMRAFFGWLKGSKMPSYYVRLNIDHLEAQVRRDAGIDRAGLPVGGSLAVMATLPAELKAVLEAAVRREVAAALASRAAMAA